MTEIKNKHKAEDEARDEGKDEGENEEEEERAEILLWSKRVAWAEGEAMRREARRKNYCLPD